MGVYWGPSGGHETQIIGFEAGQLRKELPQLTLRNAEPARQGGCVLIARKGGNDAPVPQVVLAIQELLSNLVYNRLGRTL